jgi:hypothetical protein
VSCVADRSSAPASADRTRVQSDRGQAASNQDATTCLPKLSKIVVNRNRRFRPLRRSDPLLRAVRTGISAGFCRKSFAELALRCPALRMLVASRVPVNPSRDFSFVSFSSRFTAVETSRSSGTLTLCFAVIPLGRGHSHQCGEEGTRTPDLLLAKQALYQLSYSPEPCAANRVRVLGFEPRTSALSELRSSQLSYTREACSCRPSPTYR